MTKLEYQEHIYHTHNAFCKIVIHRAAIDMALRLRKRWRKLWYMSAAITKTTPADRTLRFITALSARLTCPKPKRPPYPTQLRNDR